MSVKRELICGKLREADLNDLSMTLHRVEPAQGIDLEKERLKKLRGSFFELNPTSKSRAMPRASRHFLPGHVWHITYRCH